MGNPAPAGPKAQLLRRESLTLDAGDVDAYALSVASPSSPSSSAPQISDVENVEVISKGGVGYDSQKLPESVKGSRGVLRRTCIEYVDQSSSFIGLLSRREKARKVRHNRNSRTLEKVL
jgi:hypothetical protein